MVDPQGRLVRGTYVQIRESHLGQTVALVVGTVVVGCGIVGAIALSENEMFGGGGY